MKRGPYNKKYSIQDFAAVYDWVANGARPEDVGKSRYQLYRLKKKYQDLAAAQDEKTGTMYFEGKKHGMILAQESREPLLQDIYNDPLTKPSNPLQLFKMLQKEDASLGKSTDAAKFAITRKDCQQFMNKQYDYQLHRPYHGIQSRPVVIRPIVASYPNERWQLDIADMSSHDDKMTHANGGYKYLLVCIDCFSKKAWVKPMKDKKVVTVARVFEEMFQEAGNPHGLTLQTDNGKEFFGPEFKEVVHRLHISRAVSAPYHANSNAQVERFNKTFKGMLFKYMTQVDSKRYVDVIPKLLENYNRNFIHSSTGKVPEVAFQVEEFSNESRQIEQRLEKKAQESRERYKPIFDKRLNNPDLYPPGTKVRLAVDIPGVTKSGAVNVFESNYKPHWTQRIYEVSRKKTENGILHIQVRGSTYWHPIHQVQLAQVVEKHPDRMQKEERLIRAEQQKIRTIKEVKEKQPLPEPRRSERVKKSTRDPNFIYGDEPALPPMTRKQEKQPMKKPVAPDDLNEPLHIGGTTTPAGLEVGRRVEPPRIQQPVHNEPLGGTHGTSASARPTRARKPSLKAREMAETEQLLKKSKSVSKKK